MDANLVTTAEAFRYLIVLIVGILFSALGFFVTRKFSRDDENEHASRHVHTDMAVVKQKLETITQDIGQIRDDARAAAVAIRETRELQAEVITLRNAVTKAWESIDDLRRERRILERGTG